MSNVVFLKTSIDISKCSGDNHAMHPICMICNKPMEYYGYNTKGSDTYYNFRCFKDHISCTITKVNTTQLNPDNVLI
jgi:hypothetical protein